MTTEMLEHLQQQLELDLPVKERKILIGLAGRMHSGKSYVSSHLQARHGFEVRPLAAALKRDILRMGFSQREVLGKPAWMRTLMQAYGQAKRAQDPEYWLLRWASTIGNDRREDAPEGMIRPLPARIVVDDVRFPNEVDCLRRYGRVNGYEVYIIGLHRLDYDRSMIPGAFDESELALWHGDLLGVFDRVVSAVSGDTKGLIQGVEEAAHLEHR